MMEERFPSAPHGAQVLMQIEVTQGGVTHVQNAAMVVAPYPDGQALVVKVVTNVHNFLPPETDAQRRRRLITAVFDKAREANKLGLTTNDQLVTVDTLIDVLRDEWAEDPPFDNDGRNDDYHDSYCDND